MRFHPAIFLIPLAMAAQNDTIHVNTRLVELDVVVRAKDVPVTNLAKDDFAVFDNGKVQRIEVFSISTAERAKSKETMPPLANGVVTNRSGKEGARSATVILFDRLNTADKFQ